MMLRIAAVLATLLPLTVAPAATPAPPPPMFDLDVIVSSGSPLDWLSDIPRPIPTVHRTAAGAVGRMTVAEEAPHIRATDVFSFARITTVDLIGEIPWTVRPQTGILELSNSYPPTVNDDVLWLALAVFLRKLLHPAQVNQLEAFEYLTYLGEPTLVAGEMAKTERGLGDLLTNLRKAVNPMPKMPPPYEECESALETMLHKLTVDDLVCAHPFSFDQKFAGKISLLGDEAIPYVIKASRSTHSFLHRNATVMLGRYDDARCKERLREMLQEDPDPCTRARAVDALVRRRDSNAIPIFKECLAKTRDRGFSVSLIRGLGILSDPTAIPVILAECAQFKDDFDLLATSLTAIARIGPKTTPELEAFLKKAENMYVVEPKPTYQPVTPDPDDARRQILNQLVLMVRASQFDKKAEEGLVGMVQEARDVMERLQRNDRQLYRGMLARFNAQVVYALLEILARSKDGMEVLYKIACDVREDVVVRVHALIEFARVTRDLGVERLRALVRLDEDQPVSETAFRLLSSYAPKVAAEVATGLVTCYRNDLDQARKSLILLGVRHLSSRKEISLERLIELAEGELIRQEAEVALTKAGPGRAHTAKFEFNSPVPMLEQISIEIGTRTDRMGAPILEDILGRTSSPGRGEAAIGLGSLRMAETFPALVKALDDFDPWVRFMAYRALKFATGKDYPADWLYGSQESRDAAVKEYQACIK